MKKGAAMEEKKSLVQWVKDHKKELLIAGVCVSALILVILGIRNKDAVKAAWNSLKELVKRPPSKPAEGVTRVVTEIPPEPVPEITRMVPSNSLSLPYEVRRHIRTLPDGWHASPEKIQTAFENNIVLMPGQTWVENHMRRRAAA